MSCVYREYNYFFTMKQESGPDLDIELLRKTARKFIGVHDFRNFCKPDKALERYMDIDGELNYIRRIYSFETEAIQENPGVYRCIIKGSAFLWHQVRLMMAVLFLIA
jgi:tRNA pseudouridine38/39 synthase